MPPSAIPPPPPPPPQDINDNVPVLQPDVLSLQLLENTPAGTLLTSLNATDQDEGRNAEIFYLVFPSVSEPPFSLYIDNTTGDLFLGSPPDREAYYPDFERLFFIVSSASPLAVVAQ